VSASRHDPRLPDHLPEGWDVASFPFDGARMHRFDPTTELLAESAVRYALDRVRLDPPPLDGPRTQADLDTLGPTITEEGIGAMNALRLFCEQLAPASISQDHPRALSFVPAAPTEASVLFDLVVGASSIFAGSWMEGSGSIWAENQALAWVARLAGLPSTAGGVFVSGGTTGNLAALVTAREWAGQALGGSRPSRWYVAATADVHSSIRHVARVMDVDFLEVPGDERGRLTGEALRRRLAEADTTGELGDGRVFAVAATGGTTNLGIVDELSGVADVAAERGLWFHVDAAYGGAALAAPSARPRFVGIERADSLIVDPHKWLFAPYDCCALVYRDPALGRAAHTQRASYLEALQATGDWNPSDYAVHLTRRARGLPFWFSLAVHGTRAYEDAVEQTLLVAHGAAALIDEHPDLELVEEPELSVVVFRRLGWGQADYDAWSDRLLRDGLAFVVPTKVRGEVCLRFCFVSPRTALADVRAILATF
jgi:glutamate/tyrosine decarboxylase-like PLP-dependent enzyme